ncbi:ZBED6 C-terminal-like protein isoform X2 [Suricata suricatta]|uniref:HAT C-terminal dimerisation domain-containing protein n=2 Tax=Suricata suricatta TaxID=37032 RepID=A0A673USR9_SURSU|nr:ZBED6 C-terminal-like protein isoform X2 [Suricata suricatta]XP_029777527.1 ZBED6 C-terminal-like protein isoform X2 [Suricata suricatta]XP_029777536.1 ZBED6 C-terminal-like protein isoform X2 [Suricata suricatta]XP_029777547.1 ZBED6 C-terminal-like protein isoform X2 [Suricata suricatta]
MLDVEQGGKPPKRQTSPGSVGQGLAVCTDSSVTRPGSPAASLASPRSKFKTRATNTSHGLGWSAGVRLLETKVKLEFVDIEERADSGHSEIELSASQEGSERDLPLRRKRPHPLPSPSSVPAPDRVFLEAQEEDTLGLCVHREASKACSLGRPGLHPAASCGKHQASPGRSKPKGNSGLYSLKCVPGREPPGQPEKKVPKQKAHGQREEGEPAGKKSRAPVLSSGRSPSTPAPLHAASPDWPEVGQPGENEKAKHADLLIAHLAREVRRLKKWKKRHLLTAVGDKSPLGSLQKPPGLKKLVRTLKAETKGWACPGQPPGPPDPTVHKASSDLRRFFTIDCKNVCRVTCTLCHAIIRQGTFKGHFQTSGLVCHLVSKHGLEGERRPTAASPGEKEGGARGKKHKGPPARIAGLAPGGPLSPRHRAEASSPVDGGRQLAAGGPEQWSPAPPLSPPSCQDEPATCPLVVREGQGGVSAPSQPRTQAWTRSIAELLCSLALPLSFISSPPFKRFMAQVDPCYHVPPPAFFSGRALPLLREAIDEQVCREMRRAKGSCVHLTVSTAARDSEVDYVAVTAHWGAGQLDSQREASGGLRRQAVLWVRGLPEGSSPDERQQELREQVGLWLSRSSLQPGFLVSGGCLSLEPAVRVEGYTQLPCFAHRLDSLVGSFLRHHQSVQLILGTVRAICGHFQGSAEARQLLGQLQQQCGLPARQPFWELSEHWASACRLLEWLVEQQQPLQEYERKHQLGKAGAALSATFWSLTRSLVTLLQPFWVAVREASAARASLSQVLPQLRYLHIFLEQASRHFEEQGGGEAGAAIRLARGLALQLSADCQLEELFHHKELVLATLLDPRFKGKIESILPAGADIDHWKQVLVYKVKEIMVSDGPLPPSPSMHSPRPRGRGARGQGAEGRGQKGPGWGGGGPRALLLGQSRQSLLEQLESAGLLASERSGASLSTESHLASVMVKKYLRENETVGAQEDPLAYWERRQEVWPALARLATGYLSCPPTAAFSGSVCASLGSPALEEHSAPLPVGTVEHLLFLKSNLENFPDYPAPALIFPGGDPAEGVQNSEVDLV